MVYAVFERNSYAVTLCKNQQAYFWLDNTVSDNVNIKIMALEHVHEYSTSNSKVVTVDSNGKVTIKGTGTATITIKAAETSKYTAATRKNIITVKVNGKIW